MDSVGGSSLGMYFRVFNEHGNALVVALTRFSMLALSGGLGPTLAATDLF